MNKNVSGQKLTLLAIDTTTNAPKTGDAANLTAYVSKDDGSVTVLGDTSATELDATNAPGLYSFDLTQGETNADKLLFSGKSSTANVKLIPLLIYTRPAGFQSLTIANIWAQVVTQPAGVFAWTTGTVLELLSWLGARASNKETFDGETLTLRNRADSSTIATSTATSEGGVQTKGSFS